MKKVEMCGELHA